MKYVLDCASWKSLPGRRVIMKGTNKLTLNAATMEEVIQEWLDRCWSKSYGGPTPRAANIKANQKSLGRETYTVDLIQPEEPVEGNSED